MKRLPLDPRFTFDTFVVGPATRLAAAAARRVAESPGTAYNPLFLYSASGLGKTHLVMAIGQHAKRVDPRIEVVYETLEHLMEEIMSAIQGGENDAFRNRLRDAGLLILDDVQFLAGRRGAQEELLRAWDALSARGGQVVLASDRPPTDIDDLDDRLLSRFSGGLITDLDVPDYETRVAIVKRKADERGQQLAPGVAETLARVGFGNVRELQGGLNRVLAVQELDGRQVDADEAARLVGAQPAGAAEQSGEFDDFLAEVEGALAEAISDPSPEQRLADAILHWGADGYRTQRLEQALAGAPDRVAVEALLTAFGSDVERLEACAAEIRGLDDAAKELSRLDVLRNPDRVAEAELLVAQVRERKRALPAPPPGPTFREMPLDQSLFAVRAAHAIAASPGGSYNPLYVHAPPGSGKSGLVVALGNTAIANGLSDVAYMDGATFCSELIAAIEHNMVDGWRTRFRRARMLILDDVDALAGTERAQEELFHLFDELRGTGAQLVFTAKMPPRELAGIEDRLRTRFESGLVVDLAEELRAQEQQRALVAKPEGPATGNGSAVVPETAAPDAPGEEDARLRMMEREAGRARAPAQGAAGAAVAVAPARAASRAPGTGEPDRQHRTLDEWFLSREKVLWEWPDADDWLVEELN
jgi:chromosomal replication initiation ATPase DnaA